MDMKSFYKVGMDSEKCVYNDAQPTYRTVVYIVSL